eukprot:3237931-Amphidinium_carterae.1
MNRGGMVHLCWTCCGDICGAPCQLDFLTEAIQKQTEELWRSIQVCPCSFIFGRDPRWVTDLLFVN